MRWKGFVDASVAGAVAGAVAGGGAAGAGGAFVEVAGEEASDGCDIILKYGFLLSASVGGGEVTTVGIEGGEVAGGGLAFRSNS